MFWPDHITKWGYLNKFRKSGILSKCHKYYKEPTMCLIFNWLNFFCSLLYYMNLIINIIYATALSFNIPIGKIKYPVNFISCICKKDHCESVWENISITILTIIICKQPKYPFSEWKHTGAKFFWRNDKIYIGIGNFF